MKPIEKEPFEQLLTIIPDHPMVRILHFADSGEDTPSTLADFAMRKRYEYQINCLDEEFFTLMQQRFADNEAVKPVKFTLSRPRYMIQGKLYDYLFVTASIPEEMRELFLQRAHPIIKNGGNILLFLPKGDHTQRFEWMRLLEENNYVASNTIDDLF
jgi:hypothetical protein